jgi:hypothetical protein
MQLQVTPPMPPGHGKPPYGLLEVKSGAAWAPQYPPKIRGLRNKVIGWRLSVGERSRVLLLGVKPNIPGLGDPCRLARPEGGVAGRTPKAKWNHKMVRCSRGKTQLNSLGFLTV